ncbi:alpha/beta hydrolase [Variovorax sp. J22G73]|uniref:alpha/beta fold hydrolase n=1 Tax=unclassified Variovorax TaxID=663243 RepID=UPI000D5F7FCC|nr:MULTISPECIES: alpha/beta hydrolase [unclassified Variovorax]MDM0007783.1 alpha/beta hydrolase [Variovorax sp. J22R203]MDM0100594.1 alpha/beta hydrolase [Variovorax sp. J22G73]
MSAAFFPGFAVHDVALGDAVIHAEVGGSGPPLLLLHGYPQTHVAWHRIAPALARHFTVVAPDLRGYGDSTGPAGDPLHINHCKRTLAADKLALMRALGFERFAVMGHDRGARVGYRLCLDTPEAVSCFVSLTVIPTEEMWKCAGMVFGLKAFHWYLFAQPFDLPERMLAAEPAYYLDWTLRNMVQKVDAVTPEGLAEYHRAFAKASVRHAMVEDYRAAADIDLRHDRDDLAAGRRVACPVQVLWSASNTAKPDPLDIWKTWANEVEGGTIDCGHLMAEEAPDEVLARVLPFLQRHAGG